MIGKSAKNSKTIWFNVIMMIITAITLATPLVESLPIGETPKMLVMSILVFIGALGNAALRIFWTSQPIQKII